MMAAAFWPVWRWLAVRAMDGSSDSWECLGLATAALFLWRQNPKASPATPAPGLPVFLLLLYAATYAFLPPLLRAGIAVSAMAAGLSAVCFGQRLHLAVWGLMLLGLPVIASLDFYLGYPMRVVAGSATAGLLQMNGFSVVREGALLKWNSQLISIDAPCSGVRMLWTGLYMCFALAAFYRLDAMRTALLGFAALATVLAANVLRAAALFYAESGVVRLPDDGHAAIGLALFLLTALAIAAAGERLRNRAHAS
jgi:exosortase/archaeosortase family protein